MATLDVFSAYYPKISSDNSAFLETLEGVPMLGDFDVHVGNDSEISDGTGKHSLANPNPSSAVSLGFCANHSLSVIKITFGHKYAHKCTWHLRPQLKY